MKKRRKRIHSKGSAHAIQTLHCFEISGPNSKNLARVGRSSASMFSCAAQLVPRLLLWEKELTPLFAVLPISITGRPEAAGPRTSQGGYQE